MASQNKDQSLGAVDAQLLLSNIQSIHELMRTQSSGTAARMGQIEDRQNELSQSNEKLLEAIKLVDTRLRAGDERMSAMQSDQLMVQGELAANTEVTSEVRDLLVTVKTGAKALGIVGSVITWTVKFVGAVSIAAGAAWGAYQAISGGIAFPPKH